MVHSTKTWSLLRDCRTYLFDCDGVLWDSKGLLPGARDLIEYLFGTKRSVFLITNNSTKSTDQYADKCQKLGLPVTSTNIVCSANIAANYLSNHGIKGPVYVIGEAGIGLELDKLGITHHGIGPDNSPDGNILSDVKIESNTTCVLVGFDIHFNYRKLLKATSYICKGLPFFATNEDAQLPADDLVHPGTGSLVAAVKFASCKEPIVVGKPHQPVFDFLSQRHNIDASKTIMVGDRLDTDIAFGNRFGMHTACLMTGVTSTELLNKVMSTPDDAILRPTLVYDSACDLLNAVRSADQTN
ncbi:Nitrophenylphosphatase [Fasciola hepatica]|uniref:Nitrophenylphosphatase n=1 Tax=Fasciola hepatica TaxID=6192 RepID=A0A4E0R7U1_FASHE|nr:Nitrophenylphosphatase [Fasciola hepatica]